MKPVENPKLGYAKVRGVLANTELETIVTIFFISVLVLVYWLRLFFGVDLTDEGLCLALPYSFAKGNVPFVDELLTAPMFGILLSPFVWLYSYFAPTMFGSILFFRQLYFFSSLAFGAGLSKYLSNFVTWPTALWSALLVAGFVPFSIPTISYNTTTMICVVVGLLAASRYVGNSADKRSFYFSFTAFSLAIFIYPTLAPFAVLLFLFLIFKIGERGWRSREALVTFVGIMIAGMIAISVASSLGTERINSMLRYGFSFGLHMSVNKKLHFVADQIFAGRWFLLAAGLMVISWHTFVKSAKLRGLTAIAFLGFLVFIVKQNLIAGLYGHHLATSLGASAALSYFLARKKLPLKARTSLLFLLVTGGIFGIATTWTSSNGLWNFPIGGLVLLPVLVMTLFFENVKSRERRVPASILLAGLCVLMQLNQYLTVYGDAPIEQLKTKITSGPYASLYTTAARAEEIESLFGDLSQIAENAKSVAVFDGMPGTYLFTQLKPLVPTLWTYSSAVLQSDRALLGEILRDSLPDTIVWFKRGPMSPLGSWQRKIDDPDALRDEIFDSGLYRRIVDRPWYQLLQRK